jgi:hypothetical protein
MEDAMTKLLPFALTTLVAASASAQLELPRPSPLAKVSITLGLTDVGLEYSAPAVRGRKIWGGLVPYDAVWRTGANAVTKITFSKDVVVGDRPIAAGSYALYTIPGKSGTWTVILNKGLNGSALAYKKELDEARLEVKAKPGPARERLTFLFTDYSETNATLALEWDKLHVEIPIKAKTDEQAATNIKAMIDGAWQPYNAAARYMLENKKDYDQGLELVERSIAVKETWQNVWNKARLLAAKSKFKDAYALAERANELGQKSPNFFDAAEIKKALTDWKGK